MTNAAWSPQPGPQSDALSATWCTEIFYGGSRGGGKSDLLLGDYLQDVNTYGANWRGIIFRKTYDELEELQTRAEEIFPSTGADYAAVKRTWSWPNGAYLKMRYMEHERDYTRYHGHQYTWIGWDELTSWPNPGAYFKLISCLRSAKEFIPTKRLRSSGNPGGVGHSWVKMRFVDPVPKGYQPVLDPKLKWERMYIPARVYDNKILLKHDPQYVDRLQGTGTPELVRCWLEGDWDAIVGAYFSQYRHDLHVLPRFTIPRNWGRFRALDWGYASPFSVGWYAVSNGEQPHDLPRNFIPPGAIVRYREYYGSSDPNVGLKLSPAVVAATVKQMSQGESYADSVADPSCFASQGGPSIGETFYESGVTFRPADNKRESGWQQVVKRLRGVEHVPGSFIPMLYFTEDCHHMLRTLPAAQHDEKNPNDVDTDGEDHAVDELRYACMSRPWYPEVDTTPQGKTIDQVTLNELWQLHEPEQRGWT